ncbi:MAG: protein-disulfide reductase DsbD domain-containing protein [Aestuariivirga sp.]|uniref:protein-disulfide reductase DsbD domain-containing protein n=1 Tax=Aestuariivirga sp. TaxID=2650926 RepID=UPI00301B6B9D
MWNRLAIAALSFALAMPALAEDKPYRVSLIGDGFDGTSWHSGVLIELAPGWKTYWRMPGDSGIAPEFTWTPSRPARAEVQFPTPSRHVDEGGEAVGYEGQVIFPVTVTPEKPEGLDLKLDLFFAVCKDVCIPAQAEASISLGTDARDPLGSSRVETARADVPTAGDAVTSAEIVNENGKPVLKLALKERPEDIFIESATSAYFHAPALSEDGHEARLAISSLSDIQKLKGQAISITYIIGGKGLEQTLTLP